MTRSSPGLTVEKAKATTLEELKQRFPSDWQSHMAKAQADTLRDLIDQQLLLERGKDLGITGETELVKRLNQMRQQMGLASIDDLEAEAKKQGVSYEGLQGADSYQRGYPASDRPGGGWQAPYFQ